MAKYTFQISYNGSTYTTLTPTGDVTMRGAWIDNTRIWRENISELKITKVTDPTNYNTLASWFADSTKFATRIYIKILKDGVQDSIHWFGIRWGKIDTYLATYTVEPLAYDLWAQYIEDRLDQSGYNYSTGGGETNILYYNTTNLYEYEGQVTTRTYRMWPAIQSVLINNTGLSSTTQIVSSFINGDNYEDTSAVGTYRGYTLDYVTSGVNFMKYALMKLYDTFLSTNDVLDLLKLFRVYCFWDSNNLLRFEHVKFFNDKLADNAVDFSAYLTDNDNVFSYRQYELVTREQIRIARPTDNVDTGFSELDIVYSPVANRPDIKAIEYLFQFITNIGAATIADNNYILFGGLDNVANTFFNIDFNTLTSDGNYITGNFDSGQMITSNEHDLINAVGTDTYTLTVNIESLTGGATLDVYFEDRGLATVISNKIQIGGSTGAFGGTLTPTGYSQSARIIVEATSGTGEDITFWIKVTRDDGAYIDVPVWNNTEDTPQMNGIMSVDNIVDRWWQDDRRAISAEIDTAPVTFNGTVYNLEREKVRFHYPNVINPLYGFNDGTRIGMIDKWERSLKTDFYDIYVIYPEDE